mmetsp:Transcript_45689/g.85724  ORF Transcript_45689/g.85724 Transcript_45689/m.85724 type:complete len:546 (-) Transcript_45689:134-1771(-)
MSGFGDRLNQRQKGFKKAADAEDARRKREDAAVQLRKAVREETLQKKRMTNDVPPGQQQAMEAGMGVNAMQMAGSLDSTAMPQIMQLAQTLMSENSPPEAVFQATQSMRKLLSVEQNPPIQEVISTGVVPRVVEFLKEVNRTDLQFEAEWVLTNIASGTAEQTRVVVDAGALPIFVQLLESPSDDVKEQAVWALGNIAGDSPNLRDLVLQSGGLHPIMKVLTEAAKTSMMRNATWTLSNLCRGKPPPPFEWVSPALSTLSLLIHSTDVEALTDACWAFSYLSDGPNERIDAVIKAGVVQRLVELLSHTSPLVQTPALRAVGNIVTGDDSQTQQVLQAGALGPLMNLLSHQKKTIKKETCWAISNITAGNKDQIQEVINAGLIPPVIQLLKTGDFDIKKEAAWVISNATAGGLPQQIEYLVTAECIKPMCDLLSLADVKIISVALEAIENILRVGQQQQQNNGLPENPIVAIVEAAEGLQKIEALQEDPNEEIYTKAMKILESYFPLEDDNTFLDDAAGNSNMNQNAFQFGAQVPQGGFQFGGPSA